MTNDTTLPACKLERAGFIGSAFLCLGLAVACGQAGAAGAVQTIAGPARVIDGDTLDVAGQRIRLEGIDAPETGQICTTATGASWSCGLAAAAALRKMTEAKDVACDSRGTDKYGRMLAVCYEDGAEINAELVRGGFAWAFIRYSQDYVFAEGEARAARAGIWQGPAQPAWDYRRQRWAVAEPQAPGGCAIKGNVSGKGRIFHTPWSPWYERVTIDPSRGDRWFCSEGEAMAAGWRAVAGG